LLAAARGRLAGAVGPLGLEGSRLPVLPGATVAIVLAAAGYPESPQRDDPIRGLDQAAGHGALVFHAGTARSEDLGYRTAGGRVLASSATAPRRRTPARSPNRRREIAFDGAQRRHDIGLDPVAIAGAAR
jgi:phosphoribosylamine--glycine ligase